MWTVARLASAPRVDHRPRGCSRPRASARASSNASAGPTSADAVVFNAYDVLGVDVTASSRAVRLAFRAKAKDAHPDRGGTAAAFEELTRAHDILTDDAARAALDAQLLDVPADGLTLEELRWCRELARLEEEEDAGEVRGAEDVLERARARRRRARPRGHRREEAQGGGPTSRGREGGETPRRGTREAIRRRSHRVPRTPRHGRARHAHHHARDAHGRRRVRGGARAVPLEVTVERNCPRCLGWGEKEGHWTAAVDKLCPKCSGFGRVPVKKTIEVPVRGGVTDGETVVVHGAGDGGFAKIKTVLGEMSEPGEPGDLLVRVDVLRDGETRRGRR